MLTFDDWDEFDATDSLLDIETENHEAESMAEFEDRELAEIARLPFDGEQE